MFLFVSSCLPSLTIHQNGGGLYIGSSATVVSMTSCSISGNTATSVSGLLEEDDIVELITSSTSYFLLFHQHHHLPLPLLLFLNLLFSPLNLQLISPLPSPAPHTPSPAYLFFAVHFTLIFHHPDLSRLPTFLSFHIPTSSSSFSSLLVSHHLPFIRAVEASSSTAQGLWCQ